MTSNSKRPDSDRVENTKPVVTSRLSDCYADDGVWNYGWCTWHRKYEVTYEIKDGRIVAVSSDSPVSDFIGKTKREFDKARYSRDWIAKGDYSRKIKSA